jgi:type IV secretory pathway VirJ component
VTTTQQARFRGDGHPRLALAVSALALCSLLCTCTEGAGPSERLSYGPFHELRIYRPQSAVRQVALLLSGDGGWGPPLPEIARRLSGERTLVAGIDVQELFARYEHEAQQCVSPGGDLTDLAHYLQRHYSLPRAPVALVGHSAGATLAYIALAQAPPAGSFAGALTLSFCADLDLMKAVCTGPGVRYLPRSGGVRLLPASAPLAAPWAALHALDDTVCRAADAREFVRAVPGGQFIGLPKVDHRYHHLMRWWPAFDAAWQQLFSPVSAQARVDPHT